MREIEVAIVNRRGREREREGERSTDLYSQISFAAASSLIAGHAISLECWVAIYPLKAEGFVAGLRDDVHADFYITQLASKLHFVYRNSAGKAAGITIGVTYHVWHHVVFTYDGAKVLTE